MLYYIIHVLHFIKAVFHFISEHTCMGQDCAKHPHLKYNQVKVFATCAWCIFVRKNIIFKL